MIEGDFIIAINHVRNGNLLQWLQALLKYCYNKTAQFDIAIPGSRLLDFGISELTRVK